MVGCSGRKGTVVSIPGRTWLFAWALAVLAAPVAAGGAEGEPASRPERPLLEVVGPGHALFGDAAKDLVGWEECVDCHDSEEDLPEIRRTGHLPLFVETNRPEHLSGCEACHGPGRRHSKKGRESLILEFQDLEPIERNRVCLQCHAGDEPRINYRRSPHALAQVSCEQCHRVHEGDEPTSMRETCFGCHADVRLSFELPHGHRVEEGAADCADCHAQHGGFARQRLQAAGESACASCHPEQAGPFVYEHLPGLFGGCVGCHAPHGSNNPRQLIRHDVDATCLECHVNTPTSHDQADKYRTCLTCHPMIHGSHVDPLFQE